MSVPRSYRTIEEFEREEIRPSFRVGFSLEDLVEETAFEGEFGVDGEREEFELDEIDEEDEDEDD